MEDLGKTLGNGVENWRENLALAVPFLLSSIIQAILLITIALTTLLIILGPTIDQINPEAPPEALAAQLAPLFLENIPLIAAAIITFALLSLLVNSYFRAGAIGMAHQAIKEGNTSLSDMLGSARRNFMSLLGARLILALAYLAGVVFVVPGARQITPSLDPSNAAVGLLVLGILAWTVYAVVIGVVFAVLENALVVDGLTALAALRRAPRFFLDNKFPVLIIWLLIALIQAILAGVGQAMGTVPQLAAAWPPVNFLISAVILQPIFTVWWTRLYMTRTGKKTAPMPRDLLGSI